MIRLDENKLADYFMDKIYDIAKDIYSKEISDDVPDLELNGRPSREYLERFDYLSDNLKNAVRRASIKLKNDLEEEGFSVNIWNIETEIYDVLRCFSK